MSDVEDEDIVEVTNGEAETERFVGAHETVSDFSKECLSKVALANRLCNTLPTEGEEYDLCTSYPGFHRVMSAQTDRLMNLMMRLLKYQNVKARLEGSCLEETCDYLVDINDVLLEKVGAELDEAAGLKKVADPVLVSATAPLSQPNTSWNRRIHQNKGQHSTKSKKPYRLISARNIPRPQLQFKNKVINDNQPFRPKIKDKPNNMRPLVNLAHVTNDDGTEFFPHPYEWELEKFKPSDYFLDMREPLAPKSLEETTLTYVDSVDSLQQVLRDISNVTEIAVDLEHHAYRTYLGLTCLMQISTREKDYIIDTLSLRDELQPFNEVFTNPKVLKVFHSATFDIQWLQRDLGMYVVGMFDTYEAAKLLQYPQLSLAYITKALLGRTLDKQYQLADWRIRPLPDELLKYAREDTHYLLYIADLLKKELLEKGNEHKNLLHQTFHQSKLVCATRYETPICDESSMLAFYRKSRKTFNARQMHAFRAIFEWRDSVARKEDESHAYVMPNHMMLAVAEVLPREMQGILALCNPTPPLIKQQLLSLHHIILEARDQPLQQTVNTAGVDATGTAWKILPEKDWDSPLYCPHDLGDREVKPGLPTMMNKNLSFTLSSLSPTEPIVSVYTDEGVHNKEAQETAKRIAGLLYWLNPYERYRLVQPLDKPEITADDPKRDRVSELRKHVMSLVGAQPESEEKQPENTNIEEDKDQHQTDIEKLTAPLRTMLPYKTSKKKKGKQPLYYTAAEPGQKTKVDVQPELRPISEQEMERYEDKCAEANKKAQKQPQEKRKRKPEFDSKSSEEPPRKSPKIQNKAKSPKITKKKQEKKKERVVLTGYKKKNEDDEEEKPESVIPYDYSKEDVTKFKGGAQQAAHKLNQYANKFFKGKPKAKARKGGGKMTTFKVRDKK